MGTHQTPPYADPPSAAGTPFHRPTSIYHVPKGTDFGLRGLAANFSPAYPDTLPPLIELEPGSPTGLTFGKGAAFPARLQRALYVGDWSRGTIDAIHLTPSGASYTATREPFISGGDLRVTDITIGSDGAMYFTTGGREEPSALWRLSYSGDEATDPVVPQPSPPDVARQQSLLGRIGNLQGLDDKRVIATVWPSLRHPDRYIRHAARTAIEHHSPDLWLDGFEKEREVNAMLELAVALARTGKAEHQAAIVEKLASLEFPRLTTAQKISFLRAHGLAFIRLEKPTADQRDRLIKLLAAQFPSQDDLLDVELARMLIYLGAPDATQNIVGRMTESPSGLIFADFLRAAKDGWTPEAKANYLAWLENAARQADGAKLRDFITHLKSDALREDLPESNE